tara:strand:- start:1615 stop:2238 length:624 start_codon:yes stop_codon:yes gene_type:complete
MSKDLRPKLQKKEKFSHLSEKRVSGKCIYDGSFLKMHSDVVISSDGFRTCRDYAVHPGAVAILPFLDDSTLLLERQWRYPLNRSFLEFPAGKIDKGELPIITAQRELLEETGFVADEWAFLGEFHPVSSYSTEVIFLFMARFLSEKQTPNTDDGECIDLLELSINDFVSLIENNTISDAKTISMGFWLLRCINGEYSPKWQKAQIYE